MANNKRSRFLADDGGRKRQPYTRKEIIWQVGICVAILLAFQIQETFFPVKPKTTATPAPSSVQQQVSDAALDKTVVEGLKDKITLPTIDHKWNVYVVNSSGVVTYAVTSTNIANLSMDILTKAGYDIGSTVRFNVKDLDALAALFKLLPTNDSVTVIGANGITVDGTLYAQIGNGASKSGLKISMGTWTSPIVTPTPGATSNK